MLIFLLKKSHEKLDYFERRAEEAEEEHLKKYYQVMREIGSAYARIFQEELWKEQVKRILALAMPILDLKKP